MPGGGLVAVFREDSAYYKALFVAEKDDIGHVNTYLWDVKKDHIETFEEFREFCTSAATFFIPAFMNAAMSFPKDNVLNQAGVRCWTAEPVPVNFGFLSARTIDSVIQSYQVLSFPGCGRPELSFSKTIASKERNCR